MPIISKIGAKSLKVRIIYSLIFFLLIVGALTMIYPFALMISGSFKSETDFYNISPYPRFWTNDTVLFQKYCESKYNMSTGNLATAWRSKVGSWRDIETPTITPEIQQNVDYFVQWRDTFEMPISWYYLGHAAGSSGRIHPINERLFRKEMAERFDDNIDRFQEELGTYAQGWSQVLCPRDFSSRRTRPIQTGIQIPYQQFKTERPRHDRVPIDIDGAFYTTFILPNYTNLENYNQLHQNNLTSFDELFLSTRVPEQGAERADWEQYVRKELSPVFVQLHCSGELPEAYRVFLREKYENDIHELNMRHHTTWDNFDSIACPETLPQPTIAQVDWVDFIGHTTTVTNQDGQQHEQFLFPSELIEIHGPRQAFEQFVAEQENTTVEAIAPLALPTRYVDYQDTLANAGDLRWEFSTRNYKQVFDYIFLHGRGAVNTAIYCSLAIIAALLVNPLAAYALSRYKPPSQYTVLLFCMATMSFPTAVVMIPSFLLLKRFPLWQLLGMGATFFVVITILGIIAKKVKIPESLKLIISLGIAILVGFWLVPKTIQRPNISLLNTFAALILPGMANGYFIFLLKGFFDSLPRELYEASDLDGASEWTKFWVLTMNLSKPILAVIALQAFTIAYSAFMQAVIIIPERKMWTLMVWIYQLQSQAHPAVQFTSLVIAAIPTFIVFVLCQGVIMRGIVVPTEK